MLTPGLKRTRLVYITRGLKWNSWNLASKWKKARESCTDFYIWLTTRLSLFKIEQDLKMTRVCLTFPMDTYLSMMNRREILEMYGTSPWSWRMLGLSNLNLTNTWLYKERFRTSASTVWLFFIVILLVCYLKTNYWKIKLKW